MEPETAILIVGAGSSGLVLAIELARRGVKFRLIEQRDAPFTGSRGKGLQPRTLEVFNGLGVIDEVMGAAAPYPPIRQHRLDGSFADDTPPPQLRVPGEPYAESLMIPQWRTEEILRERLRELGAEPEYGTELIDLTQDDADVTATIRDRSGTTRIRCRYLVGTDGGRSTVRKLTGIDFPGETRPFRMLIADLPIAGLSADAWHRWKDAPGGQFALCPLAGTDQFQLAAEIAPDCEPDTSTPAIHRLIAERTGRTDLDPGEPGWVSLYRVNFRLADSYRVGRVLIAGDAAHVHPPTGGQGLNTSVQDSYNLGWKLAAALAGAPGALLDSYQAERREIAAGVLDLSAGLLDAMTQRGDMRRGRDTLQLDLHYRRSPLSEDCRRTPGQVSAGDRAPDTMLRSKDGSTRRLFELIAHPGFSLIAYRSDVDLEPLSRDFGVRPIRVDAGDDAWTDPNGMLGKLFDFDGPTLLLIRPDGYIAAASEGERPHEIYDWLDRWIGPSAGFSQSAAA